MLILSNGVEVDSCRAVYPEQVREYRRLSGLERPVAVFVGAHHNPNFEAADYIVRELATTFPQVVFVVAGLYLAPYRESGGAAPGNNVVFTGPVPEEIKESIFALADVALAPMKSGTGSSLKIPDYIAHGKIVIGTPVGLRGFEVAAQFPSVIATEDVRGAMAQVLGRLAQDPAAYDPACRAAREWVRATLDWSVVARPLVEALKSQMAPGVP